MWILLLFLERGAEGGDVGEGTGRGFEGVYGNYFFYYYVWGGVMVIRVGVGFSAKKVERYCIEPSILQ